MLQVGSRVGLYDTFNISDCLDGLFEWKWGMANGLIIFKK